MLDQVTLTLSSHDMDLIAAGLGKLPYEAVVGLIANIRAQVNAQIEKSDQDAGSNIPNSAPASTGT